MNKPYKKSYAKKVWERLMSSEWQRRGGWFDDDEMTYHHATSFYGSDVFTHSQLNQELRRMNERTDRVAATFGYRKEAKLCAPHP